MIVTYPVGGVVWDYAQYALGLERLGFDVYYLEDTGSPTYDPHSRAYSEDSTYGVQFLQKSLEDLSPTLAKRWHFRSSDGTTHGISSDQLKQVVESADFFLNISGVTLLRDSYMANPCKILIDSDPGWNHFVNYPKWDSNPGWQGTHGYRSHNHFFTYAERMGYPDCLLPDLGIEWRPTRPLVVHSCWKPLGAGHAWTTVMTWNNFQKPVTYQGQVFDTKELEFPKFETLPQRTSEIKFEMAVGGSSPPVDHWRSLGWNVIDSHSVSETLDMYRDYIQKSRGEFSVAKNLYVATRSGWFSCRSVCYLAAGRPVVLQDTGFSDIIPCGEGLFACSSVEEAEAAIATIERDYPKHQQAAFRLAERYFDAEIVLCDLLQKAGIKIS